MDGTTGWEIIIIHDGGGSRGGGGGGGDDTMITIHTFDALC